MRREEAVHWPPTFPHDVMVGFSSIGMTWTFYGLLLPLALLQFFALLFIPSVLVPGAKASEIGKAIYCYVLQTVGILLMTVSGISAAYAVVTQADVTPQSYLALLLLFVGGGVTFLWHEHLSLSIDRASRSVPFALFWYTFKTIGYVAILVSLLYLLLTVVLLAPLLPAQWWVFPGTFLAYGLLVSWCTRSPGVDVFHFQSSALAKPPSPPVHPLERQQAGAMMKGKPNVVLPKKIVVRKKGMAL